MARTACSEACLAVCLHENSFSVSRELAAQVTAPLSSGRAARSRRILVSWVIFCSGRLLGCLEIQYGHKQLGMERTTTSSLVPFQPCQPGRNKLRHALIRDLSLADPRIDSSTGVRGYYYFWFAPVHCGCCSSSEGTSSSLEDPLVPFSVSSQRYRIDYSMCNFQIYVY